MTKEDIIRMARAVRDGGHWNQLDLINFATLVAAAEREACAKVCENIYTGEEGCGDWPTPEMCANAIRARGHDA